MHIMLFLVFLNETDEYLKYIALMIYWIKNMIIIFENIDEKLKK